MIGSQSESSTISSNSSFGRAKGLSGYGDLIYYRLKWVTDRVSKLVLPEAGIALMRLEIVLPKSVFDGGFIGYAPAKALFLLLVGDAERKLFGVLRFN